MINNPFNPQSVKLHGYEPKNYEQNKVEDISKRMMNVRNTTFEAPAKPDFNNMKTQSYGEVLEKPKTYSDVLEKPKTYSDVLPKDNNAYRNMNGNFNGTGRN